MTDRQPLASAGSLDPQTFFFVRIFSAAGCIVQAIGILANSKNCTLTFWPQNGSPCEEARWTSPPLQK